MIKTAIIGASGFTGAELLRLLASHPQFEVCVLTAHSEAGKKLGELYPHLFTYSEMLLQSFDEAAPKIAECELVFSALPHGQSMKVLPALKNKVVVDLGSDFRLNKLEDYDKWYGGGHQCVAELGSWTYGLSELFKEELTTATRVANPGCYATAIILASAPILKSGLVADNFYFSAISGASGAGKVPKAGLQLSHLFENATAYKVLEHQHTGEIEQALAAYCDKQVNVSFVPHIVPSARGIFATGFFPVNKALQQEELLNIYRDAYKDSHFVKVVEGPIELKSVRGSNYTLIRPVYDERTNTISVNSVIDNLVKGAAGQAIQNANLALGLEENLGISMQGVYP